VLAAVRFKDSMRWRGDTAFSRPLRSLLALHGGAVLPFAFAGLRAGRTTHGLRSETATPMEVSGLACVASRSVPLWHSIM
jgi:glycyl-tRNA synthetase